ncbi:MAG TPA: hypothetical protein DEQ47_18315 [Solibacterales bacterium]|nr:hypothetical protein [Bryobacterales bacterium]
MGAYVLMAARLAPPGGAGEAFTCGPAEPLRAGEIVDHLRRLMGREDLEPVVLDKARAEIHDQYLSSAKAERMLGWKALYSLEDGLRRCIEWYRDYFKTA